MRRLPDQDQRVAEETEDVTMTGIELSMRTRLGMDLEVLVMIIHRPILNLAVKIAEVNTRNLRADLDRMNRDRAMTEEEKRATREEYLDRDDVV